MEIKWHGTAAAEIRSGDSVILIDPFLPLKGSQWTLDISEYDGFPDILVTHGHFDHIIDIPEIVRRNPGTKVYCTETPKRTLIGKGVPEENIREIGYGESLTIGPFEIDVYHGRHAVLPGATFRRVLSIIFNKSVLNLPYVARVDREFEENDETVMYAIRAEGKEVTVMGSLNLREDVEYPTSSDLMLLPYNGWDDNYPPAVRVIERLKPKKVFLTHWDVTFPPLTQTVDRKPIYDSYPGRISECRIGESITV